MPDVMPQVTTVVTILPPIAGELSAVLPNLAPILADFLPVFPDFVPRGSFADILAQLTLILPEFPIVVP